MADDKKKWQRNERQEEAGWRRLKKIFKIYASKEKGD